MPASADSLMVSGLKTSWLAAAQLDSPPTTIQEMMVIEPVDTLAQQTQEHIYGSVEKSELDDPNLENSYSSLQQKV